MKKVDELLDQIAGEGVLPRTCCRRILYDAFRTDTVPASEHAVLENRLQLYMAKTQHLFDKEQHWIAEKMRYEQGVQEVEELRERARTIHLELTEAKAKVRLCIYISVSIRTYVIGVLLDVVHGKIIS